MPKQSKKQPWWQLARKHALIYIGLVGVVGIMGTALVYKPLMVVREKNNFLKAQAGLEELYAEIVAAVGEPDQSKRENTCDRPNMKFSEGPLSCNVMKELWFTNSSVEESNSLMNNVSKLRRGNIRNGSINNSGSEFIERDIKLGIQIFYQDLEPIEGLSCAIAYKFPVELSEYSSQELSADNDFNIHLSCGGSARAEHFPLDN